MDKLKHLEEIAYRKTYDGQLEDIRELVGAVIGERESCRKGFETIINSLLQDAGSIWRVEVK